MRRLIPVVLALSIAGCSKAPETDSDAFVKGVLKGAGVQMQAAQEVSDKDAARIIGQLLSADEWNAIDRSAVKPLKAKAILFDYGERGRLLSLQKALNPQSGSFITVSIEGAAGIRLRHKIVVGTDLATWHLVRKESTWPKDNPFKRIYLFSSGPEGKGALEGLVCFEGAMVTVLHCGPATDKTIDEMKTATWQIAARLEGMYPETLKPIATGPLFRDNPVLTRPDLPDPDTSEAHN